MGFLLILILILALANKPKPLTEQDSSELSVSQRHTNKKIKEIQDRMSNSEKTIIKERQKLKNIEENLITSYKKDKLENMLLNLLLLTFALIAAMFYTLNTIEVSTLPYWLQVYVSHNNFTSTILIGQLLTLVCVMVFFSIPALLCWLMHLLFKRAMSDGTEAKRTPVEKFIDEKREHLQYLERTHKDYLVECEDDIKELKVKLYEIQEFSKKRKMIKDSI